MSGFNNIFKSSLASAQLVSSQRVLNIWGLVTYYYYYRSLESTFGIAKACVLDEQDQSCRCKNFVSSALCPE
jgi:hypothetical protein